MGREELLEGERKAKEQKRNGICKGKEKEEETKEEEKEGEKKRIKAILRC